MTHTKDKPWKCLSCATRFSKKSSLIRHSQNVHDMGKDDHEKFILLDEAKFEKDDEEDEEEKQLMTRIRLMRRERKRKKEKFETTYGKTLPPDEEDLDFQQLNVIPIAVGGDQTSIEVTNTVLGNLVQNDLNEVNEQFDVEVTYCEDIDILNVPNDTLFIMDNSFDEKETEEKSTEKAEISGSPVVKAKCADLEQDSEQIEDIQKFLEESKSGTPESDLASSLVRAEAKLKLGVVEDNVSKKKVCLDVPEPTGDKKPKYRIPKSPRKELKLSKLDRKTPHIPYKKESGLKIISLSENFSRNKVKNDLKSPKKHSFEQALNEALTLPSKKIDRFLDRKNLNTSRTMQKPNKQSIVSRRISQSNDNIPKLKQDIVSSPEKADKNRIVLSKPKIPFLQKSEFASPKPDVIKRILEPVTIQNSLDKKPVIKPLFKPVIKPNSLDPKRIKLESAASKLETPTSKLEIPNFSSSQLKYLSQSLKPVPAPVQSESSDLKVSGPSSQDLYNSLKADLFNNSSGLDLYRGLPVPVPAASELQSTLTTISAYLTTSSTSSIPHPSQAVVEPIKRSESQGYYTSTRSTGLPDSSKSNWVKLGTHELTDIESTDVESEEDNPGANKGQLPTFLPTNFPTFDSPCSSPRSLSGLNYGSSLGTFNSSYNPQPMGLSSIKHSGIKPTAVVSPSRPRMPVLPKPVPAAFGKEDL